MTSWQGDKPLCEMVQKTLSMKNNICKNKINKI